MMDEPLRWGIASTGNISARMTEALQQLDGAVITAVGSRTQSNADDFAAEHSIPTAHGSFDALIADPAVDIVYVGSPHSEHRAMTIAALDAGKHVLCEKAFALNAAQAREMIEAAQRNESFLMEAMWSWFLPSWHELQRRVAGGAIGEIVSIDANFCLSVADQDGRHRRPELGGGALLDLGIYPLSIGRFLLGEPIEVKALGRLTSQGIDAAVGGVMIHESGAITTFSTSLDATSDLSARIVGTEGRIEVHAPFWSPDAFTVHRRGTDGPERVEIPHDGLAHEAAHVMQRIRTGHIESDVQTWAATIANMELMDDIRHQVGVVYDVD